MPIFHEIRLQLYYNLLLKQDAMNFKYFTYIFYNFPITFTTDDIVLTEQCYIRVSGVQRSTNLAFPRHPPLTLLIELLLCTVCSSISHTTYLKLSTNNAMKNFKSCLLRK